ncbi:MAG: glycosyltransferase family 1 protein [Candidatus Jorgensenbacteria bacterium]|nr:glycosyltransferase family 1 protein [Candidatus Jorgensenbacteria bacterium]
MSRTPLRILIDARVLGKGRKSGVEEYTRLLSEHLLAADHENHYIFFTNGLRKPFFPETFESKTNASRLAWRMPNKFLDFSNIVFHRPFLDRKAQADIVLSPNINLLSTSRKSKRIITFHDLSFLHFPEFYSWRARLWHVLQRYKRGADEASAILTVSHFTARDIVQTLRVPKEKVAVIYPGINPAYKKVSKEAVDDFRARHGLKQPFILFVGVLEPRKNVASIIRSFSVLKSKPAFHDLKLVFVGRKGWSYDTIFREITDSRAKDDIVLWGDGNYEELTCLYNACEALLYPSFFEGFGFPPLEAQMCGAPVVASNRSSTPEVLGDSALLVDPWNIDEQIAALEAVIGNASVRSRYIEKGFENAKRFSWEKTARDVLNLFKTL